MYLVTALITVVGLLILWPRLHLWWYLNRVDPQRKLPRTDIWWFFWPSIFSQETFDRLAARIELVAKYGRLYITNPFPFIFAVEFSSPKLVKTIFQDPYKFPKAQFVFREDSIAQKILGNSLLMVEGEKWKIQRKSMDPAFKRKFLLNMVPLFQKLAMKIVRDWNRLDETPTPVQEYFLKLTLDAIGNAGFGFDFGALDNKIDQEISSLKVLMSGFFDPLAFFPVLNRIPFPHKRRVQAAYLVIKDLLEKTVKKAQENPDPNSHTILDHILEISKKTENGEPILSELEMTNNLFLFFIAGHETTASAFTSAIYYLSLNPDVQQKLHKELDAVLGKRDVTAEDIDQLKYLDMVIKETMRLRPPTPNHAARKTIEPFDIGGITIPANVNLQTNIGAVMRDPELWKEPERFWPERWEENIPSEQNIPFLYGPRFCIGKKFAMIELSVVLATLFQRFETSLKPDYHPKNSIRELSLKFRDGLLTTIRKRKAFSE